MPKSKAGALPELCRHRQHKRDIAFFKSTYHTRKLARCLRTRSCRRTTTCYRRHICLSDGSRDCDVSYVREETLVPLMMPRLKNISGNGPHVCSGESGGRNPKMRPVSQQQHSFPVWRVETSGRLACRAL